jgi:hypothetical protein
MPTGTCASIATATFNDYATKRACWEALPLTHTNAPVHFLASGGAGGVSIFQVSRTNCHLPSFLRNTESHLPVSTTVPFTITLM